MFDIYANAKCEMWNRSSYNDDDYKNGDVIAFILYESLNDWMTLGKSKDEQQAIYDVHV